ncbi:aspartate aminotransferase family protein [Siminovitchia sp. 179-K 8D1 HS]|uniref:aminotransferase family protein n=1 Tax=Siminovitchia sp. 179-K 8D1 HS TaxID=3142385 RepID=UPI0039A2BFF2
MAMQMMNEAETKFKELAELDKKHFLHPSTSIKQHMENGPGLIFTEGKGIYLKDVRGRKLIDSLSSLWNVNIGHGRSELGQAAAEQMSKLAFSSTFAGNSHEPVIELAKKVAEWTPGDLNTTFFTSGGSESNDSAFKTVRHYWKVKGQPNKTKIISRSLSYHGVAMGATSATGIEPFREFTTSLAQGFLYVDSSIESLKALIEKEGAENIAAFISEPIQGSGGVNPPPQGYFKEVRQICDENDILFIADEVICGFGRTGEKFGMDLFGVVPDIICMAKGISSGYAPIGGMVISDKIKNELMENYEGNFWHGYTYSGHPMCCAVALKNLEIIENENMVENVRNMGEELQKGLKYLEETHVFMGNRRGVGLLGAIEFFKNVETKERYAEPVSAKVVAKALDRGLLGRSIVYGGQDTLAFAPPFCITKEEVGTMITIIDDSIADVKKEL